MKHESNSRQLFGITRSKGKMYELGLPEHLHRAVPDECEPQELFVLTVGTLGDVAATLAENVDVPLPPSTIEELNFSASFFDAFLESRLCKHISRDTALLAASAYYLAGRPGSSLVLARHLDVLAEAPPVDKLLLWVLQAQWSKYPVNMHPLFGTALGDVARLLAFHFFNGSGLTELTSAVCALRRRAYEAASARDLLFIDIIAAIVRKRLAASAWTTLPVFTGISAERWAGAISRPEFPSELWPAQLLLGQAGLFAGASGIVQMPTSAGKTRSVEIVLRSGFLSGRAKLAVVVAPFRALCHEIGTSLRSAFREEDVKVNELSDALQLDFLQEVAELLGSDSPTSRYILVLTPEKLLYVLRQTSTLVNDIGIVVYDEGHQFDSGSRGITYELLLTEIKTILSAEAQTVLISAVIQNAEAIGKWLMGDDVRVVNGTGLLPTARSVAFASWIEKCGELTFFESETYSQPDYCVPWVIEQQALEMRCGDRVVRNFPAKKSKDVALYLGIRLVSQGAVAIFCGRKATASGMASRAVEIYRRGFAVAPPAASARPDEIRRMKVLHDGHFGDDSVISRAAALGIFVHHGTTPHGIRLSIEYAMHNELINFVACTTTLAQGVNLPIRYLIVSGIQDGGKKIKVRDFQNLVGRAGRSGMHTEGLVIFSEPDIFDKRQTESKNFNLSVELLSPERSESTSSSLLALLLDPFRSSDGKGVHYETPDSICSLILADEIAWLPWANEVVRSNPRYKFETKQLVAAVRSRRCLIFALESYLMANRGANSYHEFRAAAEKLAMATLAYHLASDEVKPVVRALFVSVAEYVQEQEPRPEKQAEYSKTLLGVKSAKAVEQWVMNNREVLLALDSNEGWLAMVWGLFAEQLDDKFFHTVQPQFLAIQLATLWLQGAPYVALFAHSNAERGTKPWGTKPPHRLTEDDIIDFCEGTLQFECSLILAAVAQFLFSENDVQQEDAAALYLFQKALKYGLPDWLSISCYEHGFADRIVAQRLCDAVRDDGFSHAVFASALKSHRQRIEATLKDYPTFFEAILLSRI